MLSERGSALDLVENFLAERLKRKSAKPYVLGLCGAQGSGKSTLISTLAGRLAMKGWRAAILSIDDLYFSHETRQTLSRTVHPLFATRGVPGTHDVSLGLSLLADLDRGVPLRLPRFDKANDTRAPERAWPRLDQPVDILLFEGWCVGARSQAPAALDAPINALEQNEDADGQWRRLVNNALGGSYQQLFARIDMLVMLAAPSFDVVRGWRTQQEEELRKHAAGQAIMNDAEIGRFIQFYERLTRHMLADMPSYADMLLRIDKERKLLDVSLRGRS